MPTNKKLIKKLNNKTSMEPVAQFLWETFTPGGKDRIYYKNPLFHGKYLYDGSIIVNGDTIPYIGKFLDPGLYHYTPDPFFINSLNNHTNQNIDRTTPFSQENLENALNNFKNIFK